VLAETQARGPLYKQRTDILREINALYTDGDNGFATMAAALDVTESNALAPREKIT
jgi:hypothetical protein